MKTVRFIGPDRNFSDLSTATIEECAEYCADKEILGCDTETTGLDFTSKKMIMLQIGDGDLQFVIDTRVIDVSPLKHIIEDSSKIIVFHNTKFDYKFLKNEGITVGKTWDTFLAEQVLNCGKTGLSNSLAAVCDRRLGIVLDKSTRNLFIGMTGQPFTDKQIVYGAQDVCNLLKIVEQQKEDLAKKSLLNTLNLENHACLAFADIEYNGLDIDCEAWLNISEDTSKALVESELELDDIVLSDSIFKDVVPKYIQSDLFEVERKLDVLWTSPMQVLKVLQKVVPDLEDVNGKNLYIHRSKHPIISKYISYKEKGKIVSSYGKEFLDMRLADGKIHTSFRQILNTGRVSSSKPNMQQIPADNKFRNCFIGPEGWVFVSSDYSSQELNVIAYGSQDPVWLEALEKGQDLHSVCAELVYGDVWKEAALTNCEYYALRFCPDEKKSHGLQLGADHPAKAKCNCPEHKKLRTNVKGINFGLAYGMGPNKLAGTLEISLGDAKKLIQKYFTEFPSIEAFLTTLEQSSLKRGYARTFKPFGRKRFFPGWYPNMQYNPSNSALASTIGRAGKNTPIQGTSADMTKYALYLIRKEILDNDLPVKIIMTVHDQIDTICREDYSETWKDQMTALMEKAANLIITNGLLKADTEISDKWKK